MRVPTPQQLAEMNRHHWFHAIDLGSVQTSGRFPPGRPQNQTLFSVFDFVNDIDVNGMDCLDIGATDGLVSFGLERRGARKVLATDRVEGKGFKTVHSILESKVELLQPVEISDLYSVLGSRRFDLIVCAGVIYHMLNPFEAFMVCRTLLKPNGLLIVESAMSFAHDLPALILNSEAEESMENSTYWTATPRAMVGMMKLVSFDVLGTRWMHPHIARGAVLGRAARNTESIADRTVLLRAMHDHGILDYDFVKRLVEANALTPSAIHYAGSGGGNTVDPDNYIPMFPLHAHNPVSPLGQRGWGKIIK